MKIVAMALCVLLIVPCLALAQAPAPVASLPPALVQSIENDTLTLLALGWDTDQITAYLLQKYAASSSGGIGSYSSGTYASAYTYAPLLYGGGYGYGRGYPSHYSGAGYGGAGGFRSGVVGNRAAINRIVNNVNNRNRHNHHLARAHHQAHHGAHDAHVAYAGHGKGHHR